MLNRKQGFTLIFSFFVFCTRPRAFPDLGLEGDFRLKNINTGSYLSRRELPLPALLFMGYTSCPDICPMTLTHLQKVLQDPKLKDNFHVLFLSLDPQRDGEEKLKSYLSYFKLNATGLTGTKQEIDRAVTVLGGHYEIVKQGSGLEYLIDHSTYIYLLDKEAKVRYLFRHGEEVKTMQKVLRDFLKKGL
ncbi:MAG: SCO family protein [Leptospiraceae bacterium]|nr:SCO family protein [Leptospiraceae bacterium]